MNYERSIEFTKKLVFMSILLDLTLSTESISRVVLRTSQDPSAIQC